MSLLAAALPRRGWPQIRHQTREPGNSAGV